MSNIVIGVISCLIPFCIYLLPYLYRYTSFYKKRLEAKISSEQKDFISLRKALKYTKSSNIRMKAAIILGNIPDIHSFIILKEKKIDKDIEVNKAVSESIAKLNRTSLFKGATILVNDKFNLFGVGIYAILINYDKLIYCQEKEVKHILLKDILGIDIYNSYIYCKEIDSNNYTKIYFPSFIKKKIIIPDEINQSLKLNPEELNSGNSITFLKIFKIYYDYRVNNDLPIAEPLIKDIFLGSPGLKFNEMVWESNDALDGYFKTDGKTIEFKANTKGKVLSEKKTVHFPIANLIAVSSVTKKMYNFVEDVDILLTIQSDEGNKSSYSFSMCSRGWIGNDKTTLLILDYFYYANSLFLKLKLNKDTLKNWKPTKREFQLAIKANPDWCTGPN
jgi:hypothetical protein